MPYADSDGVRLYFEDSGKGAAIVFVHEFADDLRSWEPQMRFFSRRYRCIAFNARGYPPSDVPKARSKYSQAIAADDIANVMRELGVSKAHIVGCSMGGYATVHFGLMYPKMALSLTAVGVGYGSDPDKREQFLSDTEVMAKRFDELGTAEA
ncbi:MAG: alpha/beta hydrolase, partial [Betaproteobacteria bacterium]|nr:alpha/beta hydrolase [Betaproteobacteria bacterium]